MKKLKSSSLFLIFVSIAFIINAQPRNVKFKAQNESVNQALAAKIEQKASSFMNYINDCYINNRKEISLENLVNASCINAVSLLWKSTPFLFYKEIYTENILKTSNQNFQIRNISIKIDSDTLDAVFLFDSFANILDFYIGLKQNQYNHVLLSDSPLDETRRTIILNFIENFRNAYIFKDIDYISDVFSEKALIITGKVVQKLNTADNHLKANLSKTQIEYQVQTKKEYINNLREKFSRIKYLNLEFKNIQVMKHRKFNNFYGVLLDQKWQTSNYKDVGILFLLIQFNESNSEPIIWVRTWQDPSNTPPESIFGLHSFRITSGENDKIQH